MSPARCVIKVDGLDCPVEADALREALAGTTGVVRVDFDLIHGAMTVHYREPEARPAGLLARVIERTGMRATLVGAGPVEAQAGPSAWVRSLPMVVSGLALGAGLVLTEVAEARRLGLVAYGVAIAAGGVDLAPRAVRSATRRRLDIHVLMALAVGGAMILGQWDEAATVAFLFGLAEALEAISVGRARSAIRALLEIEPDRAERVGAGGAIEVVAAGEVVVGERVRVRPGGRIPVDGDLVAGRSGVDQKAITGESRPVPRGPGEPVYAGTINGEGTIEVVATAGAGDALIARIIARVRAAQADRTPIERTVERFASVYTPAVVAVALGLIVGPPLVRMVAGLSPDWAAWATRGLVVLVVACPCALVIATPVAVASALAAAARRGVLVKGGSYLEEFGRLRVLAFDKTGTLTTGEPDVVEVVAATGRVDDEVLRIAAALGEQGAHPLGLAISKHARALRLDVPEADSYEAVPGLGATGRVGAVTYHLGSHRYLDEAGLCPPDFHAGLGRAEATEGTAVALSAASGPVGWIRLSDRPRPEAARVLAELSGLGLQTLMLTGDNGAAAEVVGGLVGMADLRSGLLPGDKADAIHALNAERGPTGMVGDGVNDAPALAAARVSVALGGISSPAAVETADVVLMADDLSNLPWLVRLSRATLGRIRQNIGLALAAKAVVMVLAVFSLATLWMAILADVGTTAIVTANALRLLRPRA